MSHDLIPSGAESDAVRLDPCGRDYSAKGQRNAAFRRYHMGNLLHRIGGVLPRLLDGPDLIRESRNMEELCWQDLGLTKRPRFDGDLPDFLRVDLNGHPIDFAITTEPMVLAARMAAIQPLPPPAQSCVESNLDTLARLLKFTPFESKWLLWSYCVYRFGRGILPVVPLRDATDAAHLLALLCEMPLDEVQDAMASRRLHSWGFLNDVNADKEMPLNFSGWVAATYQFAEWIEKPFGPDTDLLTPLCNP